MNRNNNDPPNPVSRSLVVFLIIGALVFLAFVVWILRTGGNIWG